MTSQTAERAGTALLRRQGPRGTLPVPVSEAKVAALTGSKSSWKICYHAQRAATHIRIRPAGDTVENIEDRAPPEDAPFPTKGGCTQRGPHPGSLGSI